MFAETSIGISLQDAGSSHEEYRHTVQDIGKFMFKRFFRPWLYNETLFNLTSTGRAHNKYLNILHSFTRKVSSRKHVIYVFRRSDYCVNKK
ncbi:PREDICTED: cytochrome P450 4C1-like [Dinoponera quadriceps]|uniref:Cytochrome P450 4C1-like n=1 Tax=Dinoponera quadriceps TaxID=609295 RepID=A0A6P3YCQ7_DINQU|nr:PREDICTED: cytochrome P450 4C1-like [Dinoponera quadriceps]